MNRVQSFDHDVDEEHLPVSELDVRLEDSSPYSELITSERRFTVTQMTFTVPRMTFTLTQMTLAVVGTHLATLGLCLLAAAVLCLRHRPPDLDLDRPDDPDDQLRHLHASTGSNFAGTGNDVKKMADMASETVYLRLNGLHPYRCTGSYLSDTSTTGVSVTR